MAKYKIFNGKKYAIVSFARTKKIAENYVKKQKKYKASDIKKYGNKVLFKIVKNKGVYVVYRYDFTSKKFMKEMKEFIKAVNKSKKKKNK